MSPAPLHRLAVVASLLALALTACGLRSGSGRACTDLPCAAVANVRIALSPEAAGVGQHGIEVDVDGQRKSCSLHHLSASSREDAKCEGGVSVRIGPVMRSVAVKLPGLDTAGSGEEPVPGQFVMQVTISGHPKAVTITHARPDNTTARHVVEPTYEDHAPNGPGCPPVCAVANQDVR